MSLHKNTQRGKCFLKLALFPFLEPLLKAWGVEIPESIVMCDPDCVLYRKGMRYWEGENKTEPFEECAINILADASENQVQRVFGLQKEMGETKNATIFQALGIDHQKDYHVGARPVPLTEPGTKPITAVLA